MKELLLIYLLLVRNDMFAEDPEDKLTSLRHCLEQGKLDLLKTVQDNGELITKLRRRRSVYASEAQMYWYFTR